MAGLTTHLIISGVLFLVILAVSRKWYYGAAAFAGHLMPDIIKFGVTGVAIRSFSYREILKHDLFYTLDHYTGFYFAGYFFWIMLIVFSALLALMLVTFKFIKKEKAKQIVISTAVFSIAAILHLIIDIFVIERNPWV
jgi:hypothetical protein